MTKQARRIPKTTQSTNDSNVPDGLLLAWLLSIIPFSLAFFLSVPDFSDTGPDLNPAFWACFILFASLQITVAVVRSSQRNSMLWSISSVCVAVLLLIPETFLLLIAEWIAPVLYIAIAIAAVKLTRRIISKRH